MTTAQTGGGKPCERPGCLWRGTPDPYWEGLTSFAEKRPKSVIQEAAHKLIRLGHAWSLFAHIADQLRQMLRRDTLGQILAERACDYSRWVLPLIPQRDLVRARIDADGLLQAIARFQRSRFTDESARAVIDDGTMILDALPTEPSAERQERKRKSKHRHRPKRKRRAKKRREKKIPFKEIYERLNSDPKYAGRFSSAKSLQTALGKRGLRGGRPGRGGHAFLTLSQVKKTLRKGTGSGASTQKSRRQKNPSL